MSTMEIAIQIAANLSHLRKILSEMKKRKKERKKVAKLKINNGLLISSKNALALFK